MGLFGKHGPWYQLNPDYRRDAPKSGLFCCRCQKSIKLTGARAVDVNHETKEVRNNPLGKELIGLDCWKAILLENSISEEEEFKSE